MKNTIIVLLTILGLFLVPGAFAQDQNTTPTPHHYTAETSLGDWRDSVWAHQVCIVTDAMVWYYQDKSYIPGISELLPPGATVKACADINPDFQVKDSVTQSHAYRGRTFLIQLPSTIFAWDYLSSSRDVYEYDFTHQTMFGAVQISGAKLVYNGKVYGQSSAPIAMSDPSFATAQRHMHYSLSDIAGGILYEGYHHALGFVPLNTVKVPVASIDGGANFLHQDFQNAWWRNTSEIPGNGIDDDLNGYVDDTAGYNFFDGNNNCRDNTFNGHGTHVTGTLGSRNNNGLNICGILADTQSVMVLKAMDSLMTGSDFGLAAAINYARNKRAWTVSMSLGGPSLPLSESAIATNNAQNIISVAASGNSGVYDATLKPANTAGVITVGASNFGGVRWSSSNYSPNLDIMAPGVSTTSLSKTSMTGVALLTGTSQATPIIAGYVGLLKKIDTTFTVTQTTNMITSCGDNHGTFDAMTAYGNFVRFDSLLRKLFLADTVVTFTACTGKHQLPQSRYFKIVDSMKYGTSYISGDSVQTNGMPAGTYNCKFAWKSEPRTGVYYYDTIGFKIIILPGTTITSTASISASPSGAVCSGTSVTFTCTTSIVGGTYQWNVNGINVGSSTPTYTYVPANGDLVKCTVTPPSGGCYTGAVTSTTLTMTVNPTVTPSVTIAASPSSSICSGTMVTFTPTPVSGGTPSYQWYKNGSPTVTTTTYASSTLVSGDNVWVVMTSSAPCAIPATVNSNTVTMTVSSPTTSTASVTASPSGAVCAGTSVTYTCTTSIIGGTYQWYVNGSPVGTSTSTYSYTPANGDLVKCNVTPVSGCYTGAIMSNTITMTVNPIVVPSVTNTASPGSVVCVGTLVTFSPTPVGGGTPSYQWYKNGTPTVTTTTYSSSGLITGDNIWVQMTSTAPCAVPTTVMSNTVTMTVSSTVTPSVSVAASPGSTVCAGTSVTFTPTPFGGGGTPTYDWYVNTTLMGTSPTYTTSSLISGDAVKCVMHSSLGCVTTPTVTSTPIVMTINPVVTSTATISVSPGSTVCAGSSVTFTCTTSIIGGTYQWYKNGILISGAVLSTYSAGSLVTGDIITCKVTPGGTGCYTGPVTSAGITMTVNPIVTPTIAISAAPSGAICVGDNVNFTSTITNGGSTPSYQWYVNTTPSGTASTFSSTTLANGDLVKCVLTSVATCASPTSVTSNTVTMTVNAVVPVPSFTISGVALFVSAGVYKGVYTATIPGSVTTYNLDWYNRGVYQTTTTTNSWVHNPLTNGLPDTVYAVLKPIGGCYAPDTFKCPSIQVHSPVGFADPTKRISYNVYPNPVQNVLNVEGVSNGDVIIIVNMLGQKVMTYTCTSDKLEQLHISSFTSGMYSLQIFTSEGVAGPVYKLHKE